MWMKEERYGTIDEIFYCGLVVRYGSICGMKDRDQIFLGLSARPVAHQRLVLHGLRILAEHFLQNIFSNL